MKYFFIVLLNFSAVSILANESATEATAPCLDRASCATGNDSSLSSLSRLVESIPEAPCPKFIIEQQILRDSKSSLTTDSPDEICSTGVANSMNHFKNASELESYLRQNPHFSDLNQASIPFSFCLSQGVSVPVGLGKTSLSLTTRTLPENKKKLAVAEYYSSLRRLSDGVERSLQNITAIDLMLGDDSLLSDVSCNSLDSISTVQAGQCRSIKQCPANKKSQLEKSAQDTLLALQGIEAIDKERLRLVAERGKLGGSINQHRNQRRANPNKQKIEELTGQIRELEERQQNLQNLYPWVLGKKFKDSYRAEDYANYANSSEAGKREMEAQVAGLMRDQLSHTRAKLKERKEDFIKASACIKKEESFCEELDIPKVLATTPPINHTEIFERDRREKLKNKMKEEGLTAEERSEYRRLLTQAGEADVLFELAHCLQTQRKAVRDVNKDLALGALDVGIVIGTMGIGSVAMAGKLALRIGGTLSKAEKLSKAKRLQGLGIFGTDVSLSAPYMQEAMNVCEDTINQLEEMQNTEQTANAQQPANTEQTTNKICKNLLVRAKHTSDVKACILQASLASLPITLPILGLSGMALARRLGKTNNPLPPQGVIRSTEAELKAKGYRAAFTDGLDEVNRMIQLAQRLRTSKADPFTTHIPEFADSIPDRIKFIRDGVIRDSERLDFTPSEQLQVLDHLEKQALDKIKEKGVTYSWWLKWNKKLSYIPGDVELGSSLFFKQKPTISTAQDLFRIFEDIDRTFDNKYLVKKFPDNIFIPTTSDLGIMTLNRAFSNDVFPVGLMNKNTDADGVTLGPGPFFEHDIGHAQGFLKQRINIIRRSLYKKVEKINLSSSEREAVETVYFLLLHERDRIKDISPSQFNQLLQSDLFPWNIGLQDSREDMARRFQRKGFREFLPDSVDVSNLAEVQEYLDESVKVFKRVTRQALLH